MADPKTTDPMIAALLREREGYERTGQGDRVAQVDEQLAVRGYVIPPAEGDGDDDTPPKTPEKTDVRSDPPKGRQRPQRRTT